MTAETMPIEDYLAQGGVLTSPDNVPARYRGELLRLMATFVDSELAASAGFADTINAAPGITARIAAARIVLEKTDEDYASYFPLVADYLHGRYRSAPMHGESMRDFRVLVDTRLTPTGTYEPLGTPCYR